MFGNAKYAPQELCLASGSRLIIFSDGLTDALNVRGEEFGDERVVECRLGMDAGAEAYDIADKLTRATADWSAGVEPFDDTTLVVIAVAG
jgi:serine phosphatase RsbU (regulator of sigma subunit)